MEEKSMWKKLKNNNKKGFTLVELIVVLVILAILAALLIPALTGYIDKAREKQIIAETRQIVMAAQTLADEQYGKLDVGGEIEFVATEANKADGKVVVTNSTDANDHNTVQGLSEVTLTLDTNVKFSKTDENGKITKVLYFDSSIKKQCVYDSTKGTYEVTDADNIGSL